MTIMGLVCFFFNGLCAKMAYKKMFGSSSRRLVDKDIGAIFKKKYFVFSLQTLHLRPYLM